MGFDRSDDRFVRLERSLLGHDAHGVTYDPAGDLDLAGLGREMARLGFELVACDQQGYEYAAEFRLPARPRRHAVHGTATSFSRRNAVIEAAIAALEGLEGHGQHQEPRSGRAGFMPELVARAAS